MWITRNNWITDFLLNGEFVSQSNKYYSKCILLSLLLKEPVLIEVQTWTKVLGHFCISGRFPIQTGITPPPPPKNNVGRLYLEFFPSFNFLWVGRENCEKISRKMHCFMREPRMTEKSEYCITVLGTFIHNCRCFRRPSTSLSSLVLISSYDVNGFFLSFDILLNYCL